MELNHLTLPNRGAMFRICDGILEECVLEADGRPVTYRQEYDWGEVTAPESQEFLDEINAYFGTDFKMGNFAHR